MSTGINKPIELSIKALLNSDRYVIPIYQRNYAWGKKEIEQLLQDIIDRSSQNNSNYYLGTLIVNKKENGDFEIIDGQQRHTTLTFINTFLQKNNINALQKGNSIPSNLLYEARPEVEKYLNTLNTDNDDIQDESVIKIKKGFEIVSSFFNSNRDLRGHEINTEKFKQYFYEKVIIIRVNVPKDTDINHYFEIMNTRGIQLEKHQILKAKFIENLKNNKELAILFGKVWDACANMEKYIQYCFDSNLRKIIFGSNLSDLPKGIEEIKIDQVVNLAKEEKDEEKPTLKNILAGKIQKKENVKKSIENDFQETGKYSSIIDFPNFLLQVLRIYKKIDDVSLDDKNLLDAFGYNNNSLPNSIEFIDCLLKFRTFFDKYFIKKQVDNNNDDKWVILKPADKENDYLITTFSEDSKRVIMGQSMFQVSFPSNSYKNWLNHLLNETNSDSFSEDNFFIKHIGLANKMFRERTKDSEWLYCGTGINNYIFNYTDFLLWKAYEEKVKGKTQGFDNENLLLKQISGVKKYFDTFRFTQRSSVEHIHPQNDKETIVAESEEEKDKILNSFGNLCLISNSSNSKYNDFNFNAKKQQFNKRNGNTESLKQVIIFSYTEWNSKEIKEHGEKIIELLNQAL